jgi:VanZ family protein
VLRNLWPAFAWAVIILVLTGIPGTAFPKDISFLDWASPDKIVHFILFGGQSFLILYAFRKQYFSGKNRSLTAIAAVSIGIIFGLLTEVLQFYVFVGRNGNHLDFLADLIGALMGFLAFYLLYNKKITATKANKN